MIKKWRAGDAELCEKTGWRVNDFSMACKPYKISFASHKMKYEADVYVFLYS